MKRSMLLAAAAVAAAAAALALVAPEGSAVAPANDVTLKMKLADTAGVGPLATLMVKNAGTNAQTGVVLKIYAESEMGLELWSGTVDILPKKTVKVVTRVYLDQDTTALAATAALASASDEDPTDNIARGGLGLKGAAAKILAGRAPYLAHCASCHGDAAEGTGAGPTLVGKKSKDLLLKMAAGGAHAFPWFSKTDAKNFFLFLKNPAGVQLPPSLPQPPVGGWPTFSGAVTALYAARCVSCHGPSLISANVRLDTYQGAVGSAKRALFAVKMGTMPQGGKRFTADEIQLMQDWITGGYRP